MLIGNLLHSACWKAGAFDRFVDGFARVVLSPAEKSISFYERAGFGPAGALMLRTLPADQS